MCIPFVNRKFKKIDEITKPILDKGISENPPKFVIFMGGVGSGKTTTRRQQFTNGYVHFDSGEINNAIKKEVGEYNPKLESYVIWTCGKILQECLNEKKNIVIEIIGDNKEVIESVAGGMKKLGYEISLKYIHCDPVEAYKRHLKAVEEDKDYLSAYFTQEATLSFFYQLLQLGEMPSLTKT